MRTSSNYFADTGTSTFGGLHSYGVAGVHSASDRALGSIGATSITYTYGVRFTNDTAAPQTNITVAYTGEQWRTISAAPVQTLTFAYAVSSSPITNSFSAAVWINFPALSFGSSNLSAATSALDGNAASNRQFFSGVVLPGVVVAPGQEIFLRWQDVDDTGSDSALAIDDLTVSFVASAPAEDAPPLITTQPQSQTIAIGADVTFTVAVTGNPPPAYQWQCNGTNLIWATNAALTLSGITTNQAGDYTVTVTNALGATNSQPASLTVFPPAPGFSLMTYNTHGNFVSDWTTNSLQVQAIGRQVQYLDPDIITFQEIPLTNNSWTHMPEFVTAFRPGYYLATNSGSDGFIRSVILSRHPITRSTSWLDGASLTNFGYNGLFARDLFEAQIAVPGFSQPLHVFTVHLKSGQATAESNRRAAEANAISNFFAHGFLTTNRLHPYVLTGDLNEDLARPPASDPQSLQRLTSVPTGLQLTTPVNPFSGSELTHSIQLGLGKRYDYILPCMLLLANVASSQVFRTDLLPSLPPTLQVNDDVTASDHLPVLMEFNNPYDQPFRFLSLTRTNLAVTLQWETVPGQPYRVETSTNLTTWSALASNLVATSNSYTFGANLNDAERYFRISRGP